MKRPLAPGALRLFYLAVAAVVLVCDRLSKIYIRGHVALNFESIPVIPHLFSITHVENTGAAFSLMADWPRSVRAPLLIGFSVIALVLVCYMLWKSARRFTWLGLAMALILGGAAGNLYDRVRYGHVTDFLHFYIGVHAWPDFNVADSAIVVGCTLLVLYLLIGHDFAHDQ
jgi:signal peptidase II